MISLFIFLSGILCLLAAGVFLKKLMKRSTDESFVLKPDFVTVMMSILTVVGIICIISGIILMLKIY